MRTIIIAEAGVNHNGSLALAKKMAEAAKAAGADYVKYQTFVPRNLVSQFAEKAEYQKETTGGGESQRDMLEKLSLSFDEFRELAAFCREREIGFISTPFDLESLEFLCTLDMPFWKVPSGELTNLPYLEAIAATGKPVVMSTGMGSEEEIGAALDILKTGGSGDVTLLHCTTEYPAPYGDVNLLAMKTMRERFGFPVGYSDHTRGIEIAAAAAALGAVVIEKHFTLDKTMEGPDHRASLEPEELRALVDAVRHVEAARGNGKKQCAPNEAANRSVARKSIVAKRVIRAGELFSEENITVKRPGTGISPMRWHEVLGKRASRDFCEDELIEL